MPIVSEHPRALEVLERLTSESNTQLENFLRDYHGRREAYRRATEERRKLVEELEDGDRQELDWRELVTLLEAREEAVEEFRVEIGMLDREITLLKREVRRARRRLLDAGEYEEVEYYSEPSPDDREPVSVQSYVDRLRDRPSWDWVKPWLRSFLPSSA